MENDVNIFFEIDGLTIRRGIDPETNHIDEKKIPTYNQNLVMANFKFSNDWNGIIPKVVFQRLDLTEFVQEEFLLDTKFPVPAWTIIKPGMVGISIHGGNRKVSDFAWVEIVPGGYTNLVPTPPPTPPETFYLKTPDEKIWGFQWVDDSILEIKINGVWRRMGAGGLAELVIDNHTLVYDTNGVLKVNTTNDMEQDNTRPITAAGVHTVVGNINSLLELI
jgi:hypothetical protein